MVIFLFSSRIGSFQKFEDIRKDKIVIQGSNFLPEFPALGQSECRKEVGSDGSVLNS